MRIEEIKAHKGNCHNLERNIERRKGGCNGNTEEIKDGMGSPMKMTETKFEFLMLRLSLMNFRRKMACERGQTVTKRGRVAETQAWRQTHADKENVKQSP